MLHNTSSKIKERHIEAYLVERIKEIGGEIRKVVWLGRIGAPDRVVMLPGGILVWIELKAPGKKPEPHQEREHERMRRVGQRVVVLDSVEGVEQWLKQEIGDALYETI